MMDLIDGLRVFFLERDTVRVLIDVVDVLLVGYLIYRVLLLIRGTRAMQMGVGLVLVFVVYNVARRGGLITLFSLLDAVLTYIVIIIVILFQNDIRRALMRVGARPLFRSRQMARESQVIEEVVKASQALAQKRIGALVVFEREASLDEFIEHGIKLDSEVSKELLYSVFVPSYENPMHDGAVVIRDGRVWEAGAFLPLTESTKVDRTLGTRHRAAIGISEETDAVVVVVSEERGTASLCFGGNIVRDLDTNMLRHALVGLFEKRARKTKPKQRRARPSQEFPERAPSVTPESPKAEPSQRTTGSTPRVGSEAEETVP